MARKSRGKRRTRPEATVDVEDVDEFISNRHKVMLERDEGEEGDDVSEEEEDVPVMDIGGVEEEDDSDDDEEEEGEEEEVESGGWTMKRSFYGGDNAEFNIMSSDEEEQLREEEVEAVKMQRKEAEAMMTQDFGLVDDDEDEADDDEEESNDDRTYSKKKTKSKKDETFRAESDVPTSVMDSVQRALANPSDEDDDDDDDDVDEPDALKLLASTSERFNVEQNLTDAEKRRVLEEQSPELFRLLEDLRRNLEILRETAEAPVNFNKREGGKKRRRWRRKKGGAGGGVEKNPTLEVQRQWLLQHARINYCMNICFYLMYKAEGRDVRSHPVIAHLVSIRKHIDRLEKTQIAGDDEPADLLEQISSDAQNDDDEEEEEEETGQDRYIDWTQDEKGEEEEEAEDRRDVIEMLDQEGVDSNEDDEEFMGLVDGVDSKTVRKKRTGGLIGELDNGDGSGAEKDRVLKRLRVYESRLISDKRSGVYQSGEAELVREEPNPVRIKRENYGKQEEGVSLTDEDEDDVDEIGGEELRVKGKAVRKKDTPHKFTFNDSIKEDARRGASREVIKNRGLTPYRSKKRKNPRLKHRKKFELQVTRHKGAVREVRTEKGGGYGGEATGVNVRASKSTKL